MLKGGGIFLDLGNLMRNGWWHAARRQTLTQDSTRPSAIGAALLGITHLSLSGRRFTLASLEPILTSRG